MKKIVSNALIVSTQLIVGGLFLFMLFSDNNENNKVVTIENNNLNKMSDAVNELFIVEHPVIDDTKEEELTVAEEVVDTAIEETPVEEVVAVEEPAQEVVVTPPVEEVVVAPEPVVTVDATGYISKPSAGFNVTTGNKTYTLTDEEFAILATVVNCEANRSSKDDILAVMSVILNRADSSRYPNDPVSVVAAPSQFSCYTGNGSVVSDFVANVMRDALNGVRNNSYYGFRSWYSSYSNNYIVENGNRYA